MAFFDPEKNQEAISEEKQVFFDIILANLEKHIAGYNNITEQVHKDVELRSCSGIV